MKKLHCILFFLFLFSSFFPAQGSAAETNRTSSPEAFRFRIHVERGDTIFSATLPDVYIYAPLVFKNKKEERFYWRTVRDVKRTLPYAKIVSSEVIATNKHLMDLPDDKARKEYMEQFEKELFKKYEGDLRKMTFSQGKMLIKLIDRECDQTSYSLIKIYRGGFSAAFWQGIAKIFGADLKSTYNTTKEEDQIIERVIMLVEAGQL